MSRSRGRPTISEPRTGGAGHSGRGWSILLAGLVVGSPAAAATPELASQAPTVGAASLPPPRELPCSCLCPPMATTPVTLGIDVLLTEQLELIAGRRIGLLANAASVDGRLVPTVERLRREPRVRLVQLYAPEHGLQAALPNGRTGRTGRDPATGLPLEGIFTRNTPSRASLARLDAVVVDLQDVGSRTYTYVTSLGNLMLAAAAARVRVIVLDRPNPQGGRHVEGAIRAEQYRSLIGWGPLPVTHGMTIGELARFYEGELKLGCDLVVVPMRGWRRDLVWQDTGLHWLPTSAGIPHVHNAQLYVATGMVGGAGPNLNEGAGASMPFELLGAPYVDGPRLAEQLNQAGLPGVHFRPIVWQPRVGQFAGQTVRGVQLLLLEPRTFLPLRTALTVLTTLQRLHPGELKVRDERLFGRCWGNDRILPLIRAGQSPAAIEATWAAELEEFRRKREQYLIYP